MHVQSTNYQFLETEIAGILITYIFQTVFSKDSFYLCPYKWYAIVAGF